MSFVREGIRDVRTVVLVDAIARDGRGAAFSRAALVRWRSSLQGSLYHVYVNRALAGTTVDPAQRHLVVIVPSSFESAVDVEVVAVEPCEAHIDFSQEIGSPPLGSSRVKLTFLRSQNLPPAATANIYSDQGTSTIDYDAPLNRAPIPLWPCRQDKAGFGMAWFGAGDFGYDAAAAVGFAKGAFGYGSFGLDADLVEWIGPALSLGGYRFGTMVLDGQGNESPPSETAPIAIVPAARPAAGLEVAAFEKQTNELTLRIEDRA